MAIVTAQKAPLPARFLPQPRAEAPDEVPMFDLIELFFFAYRDFVGDADRLLERYHFGRAHHRVLHFVGRNPGLTIARLLGILKITKQSLNRVMKDLTDAGFIEVRHGVQDRRQRHLHLAPEGVMLAGELARIQNARFKRALGALDGDARDMAVAFLLATIDPQERDDVVQLVFGDAGSRNAKEAP